MRPAIVLLSLLSLLSLPAAFGDTKKPATGTLHLGGPPNSDVTIDGKRVGKTPYGTTLVAGEHLVVVTRPNHTRFEKRVTVVAGKTVELTAVLEPFAEVRVLSSPRGASVTVDGTRRGTTPLAIAVEPGDHFFEITHDGFQPKGERIKIAGPRQNIEITLAPAKP